MIFKKKKLREQLKSTKRLLVDEELRGGGRRFILFSPSRAVRQSTAPQMKGRKREFVVKSWGRLPPNKRRFKRRLSEVVRQIAAHCNHSSSAVYLQIKPSKVMREAWWGWAFFFFLTFVRVCLLQVRLTHLSSKLWLNQCPTCCCITAVFPGKLEDASANSRD